MTKKLIIISGNLQNGKDTFCDFIQEQLRLGGESVSRYALASKLREHIENYCSPLLTDINSVIDKTMRNASCLATNHWFDPNTEFSDLKTLITHRDHIFGDKNFISRHLHQILGELVRREVNSEYWVKQLVNQIDLTSSSIIISDMRWSEDLEFLMDCDLLKDYEITTIRVERVGNNFTDVDRMFLKNTSENAIQDYDQWNYVVSASSIEELKESAISIILDLKGYSNESSS